MRKSVFRVWLTSAALAVLVLAGSLIIGGCTSNAVAPENGDLIQTKLEWLNEFFSPGGAQLGPGLDECTVLYDTVITDWVDSHGDNFEVVNGNEKIKFKLPDEALVSGLQLTLHVTKYQAPFGSFWLLDCGPEGTVFAKSLEVSPNDDAINGNWSVLFYFNPDTGQWEVEQSERLGSELLIDHFSKYGIS